MSFSPNDPRNSFFVGLEPGQNPSGHKEESLKKELTKAILDNVNHPKHYQGKYEVIDIIEGFSLGFNLGNLIKYVLRAGKKDPSKHLEDLEKAKWYLEREIHNLKNNK